jgi:hypothetical protein
VSFILSCYLAGVQSERREIKVETPFTYQDIEHFVGVYLPSRSKSGNIKRSPISAHSSLCIQREGAEFAGYRLRKAGWLHFLKDSTVQGPAALSTLETKEEIASTQNRKISLLVNYSTWPDYR